MANSYQGTAIADGFDVTTFAEGAKIADVVFLLVPDQVAPGLYNSEIGSYLKEGALVVVASGFNIFYERLEVGKVDVGMVAPGMIGARVRSRFLDGGGFPCFDSVEKDFTGRALERVLSLALGIGGLTAGAVYCSARDETLMDLFAEQAVWPNEALVHELWLSKEPAEVFEKCAEDGFISQLKYHSTVSQYGQLSTSLNMDVSKLQEFFKNVAENRILGGGFTKEFIGMDNEGGGNGMEKKLEELYTAASTSELRMGLDKV
ncbi:NAD(P)-binding protein [Choiromyces venosus 120613-1]|uniref:NAD(P)-binding protein n=1 Tax=Choiromyces venosus 120613-1 TaxID=1336337 RepID=A0A3N4JCB4_9PEZI|nr:NAD(P)-binding protein [Choiromyces venosus 120613-1]